MQRAETRPRAADEMSKASNLWAVVQLRTSSASCRAAKNGDGGCLDGLEDGAPYDGGPAGPGERPEVGTGR